MWVRGRLDRTQGYPELCSDAVGVQIGQGKQAALAKVFALGLSTVTLNTSKASSEHNKRNCFWQSGSRTLQPRLK
jgi:hypothetical protein